MNSLRYLPGDWYALVGVNHVVVLPPDTALDTVKGLWDVMDGKESLEQLLSTLLGTVGMKITAMPDFAMVSRTKAPHVMVRGAVQFTYTDAEGRHKVSAADIATWTEQRCAAASAWSLSTENSKNAVQDPHALDIIHGMVRTGALHFGTEDSSSAAEADEAKPAQQGRRAQTSSEPSTTAPEATQLSASSARPAANAAPVNKPEAATAAPEAKKAEAKKPETAPAASAPDKKPEPAKSAAPAAAPAPVKKAEAAAPVAADAQAQKPVAEPATEVIKIPEEAQAVPAAGEPDSASVKQTQSKKIAKPEGADDADTKDPESYENSVSSENISLASVLLGKRDDPSTQYQTEEPDDADTIIKPRSAPASPAAPAPDAVDNEDTVYSTVLRTPATPPQAAAPELSTISSHQLILARVCTGGHPNPPEATSCRTCHVKLSGQATKVRQPSMGRMFVTEQSSGPGSTHLLTRSVVIGRQPTWSGPGGSTEPKLMKVLSPNHDISRSHVQVKIDGWHVELVDLGATNGTVLLREGQSPHRLGTKESVLLLSGDVADLGDGVTLGFKDLP
ncbi:FHA domain-containing protein [Glutamicibacter sp.]|uniref:FHA domain-containing protein n=1 Tax=Glutamicibacter sp. TaxID=1931995 RepID=UPI0028BF20B4|nr:FHA domain-containing protein [Glutamicibacter sp.]